MNYQDLVSRGAHVARKFMVKKCLQNLPKTDKIIRDQFGAKTSSWWVLLVNNDYKELARVREEDLDGLKTILQTKEVFLQNEKLEI